LALGQTPSPWGGRLRTAARAVPTANLGAVSFFVGAGHWSARRILKYNKSKQGRPDLIVPIGTFSEPCELSGTQADSGSCPPVVFYASNRLISSISVICFVMFGACSPSCIGLSTL